MKISARLQKEIITFLMSLPNIHDANTQRAFIYKAGLDPELQAQIPFDKPSAQFIPILVKTLLDYGKIHDGREALESLLEEAKYSIGVDRKADCDILLNELRLTLEKQPQRFSEQLRTHGTITALVVIITVVIVGMSIFFLFQRQEKLDPFPNDMFGILVAVFEGSTQELQMKGQQIQYDITTILNARFDELHITNAFAKRLPASILSSLSSHEKAREIGRQAHAELVIWGAVSSQGIIPSLTVVNQSSDDLLPIPPNVSILKDSLTHAALKDMQDIRLPPLTDEPTLIASFVTGLKYAKENNEEKAIEYFKLALPKNPDQYIDSAPIFYCMGNAYFKLRSYDEAIANYTALLQINPNYECIACTYILRGDAYRETGKISEAIVDYTHALSIGTQNVLAYARLAEIHENTDDILALKYYRKALEQATAVDDLVAIYQRVGHIYYRQRDFKQVIINLTKAIELKPERSCITCIYLNRASAYKQIREYDKAIVDHDRALNLEPESTEILNSYAWLLATCPDARYRNGNQSIIFAQRAIENSTEHNSYMWDTLATGYAESGQFDEAITTQKKAIELLREEQRLGIFLDHAKEAEFAERLEFYRNNRPWRE